MIGFDGSQGRAHVHRSILEGIALTMHGHLTRLESDLGRAFDDVLVAGGGSRSDLMMQILADVLARPVRRTASPDAAGVGAAVCAAVGAGVHPDWDTATAAMVVPGRSFPPDPAGVAAYRPVARTYARLGELTDPVFAWTSRPHP